MNYSEKWGKSVEEAVELALKDLKLTKEEVDVEVLEEPSNGFLGIGSKPAKVRVTKRGEDAAMTDGDAALEEVRAAIGGKGDEQEPAPQEAAVKEKEATGEDGGAGGKLPEYGVIDLRSKGDHPRTASSGGGRDRSRGGRRDRDGRTRGGRSDAKLTGVSTEVISVKPEDLVPVESHEALDFLRETTAGMGLDLSVAAEANDEFMYITLAGEDAGAIIGKRGQTLDAIQYLTSLVVNKEHGDYVRVVVDAENYRAKREKTLQQLAIRLGTKVLRTGRPVKLEPMNPYERMVIHATLGKSEEVTTISEGEEPYRRVIIEKKQ